MERLIRSAAAHSNRFEVDPVAPQTDEGVDEFAATLGSSLRVARLRREVTRIARRRLGIRADDAEDLFQDSVVAYLEMRHSHRPDENHLALFVGVLHRMARASLATARRRARGLDRWATRFTHDRRGLDARSSPDAGARRAERDAAIRGAIAAMSHDVREALIALADGRCRRLELIAQLGINRNTFDSRLHKARSRLRCELARRGES